MSCFIQGQGNFNCTGQSENCSISEPLRRSKFTLATVILALQWHLAAADQQFLSPSAFDRNLKQNSCAWQEKRLHFTSVILWVYCIFFTVWQTVSLWQQDYLALLFVTVRRDVFISASKVDSPILVRHLHRAQINIFIHLQ